MLAEDKLFATLDTRSRTHALRRTAREVVVTDTVGFIRDLPKDLFAAFRATFEEAADADLLLHVVDAADPACEDHLRTTEELLRELGLCHVRKLLLLNKCDLLPQEQAEHIAARHGGIMLSAHDPNSLDRLRRAITVELNAIDAALDDPPPREIAG